MRGTATSIRRAARSAGSAAPRAAAAWLATLAFPAHAQDIGIGGSIALQSNQMFRGESISRDAPGFSAAVAVDGLAGLYAGADVAVALVGGDPQVTMNSQYAGLARRSGTVSFEVGAVHRHYRDNVDTDYNRDFFEGYAGLSRGATRLRLFVSPDYLRDGRTTYYLELESRLLRIGKWSLQGHGGLSLIPQAPGSTASMPRAYEDWSLTLGRDVRGFNLGFGLASSNYPVIGASGEARFSATVRRVF